MGYIESLMGQSERIVFIARQHWITLARQILIDGLLAGAVVVLGTLLLPFGVGALAYVLLLIPLADFMRVMLAWTNEQYIITNRRVIQVEGVFQKHVIDSSLEKVNDVVMSQSVIGRALNFGTIEILTGSEMGVNKLDRIASPIHFKTAMLNAKEAMSHLELIDTHARGSQPASAGDVPELIAELDELRQKGLITQQEFERKKQELLSRI